MMKTEWKKTEGRPLFVCEIRCQCSRKAVKRHFIRCFQTYRTSERERERERKALLQLTCSIQITCREVSRRGTSG
jgi:hypothetical protein